MSCCCGRALCPPLSSASALFPWRYFHSSAVKLTHTGIKSTGLYGFHHLKTAQGFQHFVDEAIERSEELITSIPKMSSSMDIIGAVDEISNTVCSVVDSAELCRRTHPDNDFIKEATKAWMKINEHLHYLNTNKVLYNAVRKAEQDGHLLVEEAQRAAHHLHADFEKGGIHLPMEKLNQIIRLRSTISQLCRKFDENITSDPGNVNIFPASRIPHNLHRILKPIYPSMSSTSIDRAHPYHMTKGFQITTESTVLATVLQWVADDEIRKLVYIKGNSVPHANLSILDKLIAARHEFSQVLGFRSYSEFMLQHNMASSPNIVKSFLVEMSELVRPKADEELKSLTNFKREKTGNSNVEIEAWDEAYFMLLMKSSTFDLNPSLISSYFPLNQCIEGLKCLVESLFGATFQSTPLAPGESWHPSVLKFYLYHPEEGGLGYLYLDLYPRLGKYPGCAHFAIRGCRKISEMEYQLPVVALVCNFLVPQKTSVPRLNHGEVETLFHEFGHALHSLLSRTNYQHFSGTRVALDLAEMPSNLFEYYAWDHRVLRMFAKHYSTGEIIPKRLVDAMRGAEKMFAGMSMQKQVLYALIDQELFGEGASTPRSTVSVISELKRQHTSCKHVDGTHSHTRFNHLLNYGAGYYSYLYAKCFAATIWRNVCEDDPLSLATGSALRFGFLRHGGAKDPAKLLQDLVPGGTPIVRVRGAGIVPDLSSLSQELGLSTYGNTIP